MTIRQQRLDIGVLMRPAHLIIGWLCFMLGSSQLWADFSCSGVLTSNQQQCFMALFSHAYSALTKISDDVTPDNMFKVLSQDDINRVRVDTAVVVATTTLSAEQSKDLKGWLNENASSRIPGWFSTRIAIPVPQQPWVGLSAEVFVQLVNSNSDNGRFSAANLARTVTKDRVVGVTEQVANDSSGHLRFL